MRGLLVAEGPLRVPSGQALRQGQDERIWEARVRWGVGDAMGDGDAPRRAPALGSRESGNDDGGCGWMRWREGLVSGWEPALAGGRFANRPYDRGGAHEGGGDAGAAGGGRPPSSALRTGFDRVRANGFGKRACGGEWGMRWGDGDALRLAPALGSRESGNDDGGVVGRVGARGSGQGGGPLSRAGGSRTAPTTGVGRTRAGVMRGLLVVEGPPSCALRTGFERLRANGFRKRACGGEWGMRSGDGDAPRRAPALGSRESGNDDGGCGGMRWREGFGSGWAARGPLSRAGGSRTAPTTGEFAESRVCARGPFVCPQDRLRADGFGKRACSGEWGMRWGVWWDELARGVGVRVGARSRGRAVREPPLRPGWGARGRGCARGLLVVEGPPSSALRTGFDRLRANGFGKRACGGEWGMRRVAFARW